MKKRVLSAMPSQTFAEGALDAAQQTGKLSYDGYKKVWSDEFNGDSLNRADWNVETHEKGWVNNELQEYVDSSENIQVKDGKLIINPVKKVTDGDTGSTKKQLPIHQEEFQHRISRPSYMDDLNAVQRFQRDRGTFLHSGLWQMMRMYMVSGQDVAKLTAWK